MQAALARPGAYRIASSDVTAAADEIERTASSLGLRVFRLRGRDIDSKASFLESCARACRFPSYFGHNWDALEECLRDFGWLGAAKGFLLVYEGYERFARRSPDEWLVAVDVLRSSAAHWASVSTPLVVLLLGEAPISGIDDLS